MKKRRKGAGRTLSWLAGGVLLCCAAVIDPSSVLRPIPEDMRPAPVSTWPRTGTDPFTPAVARAAPADHPQRRDDLQQSIIIEDFGGSDTGGFPLTWKAWRGDD